ncbi:hypothetical protein IOK49_00155 [Fervidicoccus fontis]|uniref:Thioredoxin-like fold domain-containing protein n=2 Tax=Fervidicoccus fontis TaxID=683846 RepID=I0A2B6_FERFK|nr:hypothetical protein [Fervidicoccus fontis]AFH43123.1 hypothetical protein FFONT_1135 [Fervidicoccus fontis Kam940]MBE9390502.1 hypothetical protein [Fervidicoccus fontis]PMB75869.1 MAG: hypothetical protein C0188_01425 [Fervidicoccus fontis]PMB77748.1 MAG: hypothetical protein C0177_02390 [Fervidicoccus fontis]HEW64290.1 hypothetical protein [Fervidicoccus fontis]
MLSASQIQVPSDSYSTKIYAYKPKITLILDWSYESSETIKNVLKAKKTLFMNYLIDIDVDMINLQLIAPSENLNNNYNPPAVFLNGKLLSESRTVSEEEIIDLVLSESISENKDLQIEIPSSIKQNPVFGSSALAYSSL